MLRIDKFLWAVRIYKTRTLATEACRNGRVYVNGQMVKASRDVQVGDKIAVRLAVITKTIQIDVVLETRVAAKLVPNFITDLTTADEYLKETIVREHNQLQRERGSGRPTKKERRDIDKLIE